MLRRIGVLASLAVVAAMFAGVSTASAQTAGVCVFTGVAGNLTPPIDNVLVDPDLGFEQGSYDYSSAAGGATSLALCAGVADGAPVAPQPALIESVGGYDNIVCGTGFAHDADGDKSTISAGALSLGGPNDPGGYQIPFVAGVGPLLIGPDGTPNLGNTLAGPNPADPSPTIWSNYVGTGLVQITPGEGTPSAERDNCITPAVAGNDGNTGSFEVKGFLVGAKYQDGADGALP